MDIAITIVHVIACFFLIIVVLLQTGKGADIGAVFGGSSQTVFGSGGAANLLTRLTTYTAVVFMLTSLFLTWVSTRSLTISVADDIPVEPPPLVAPAAEPAAPAAAKPAADAAADAAAEPAAADPVTGEEPAPEKPAAAAAGDAGEDEAAAAGDEGEDEAAAEATAGDVGAALEASGTGSVEQIEEEMKKEDDSASE